VNERSPLALRAGFERQLVRINRRSVRYLVVEATAPEADHTADQPTTPLNLGLVLDASGSMDESEDLPGGGGLSRLEAAKRASVGVVQHLGERDCLSLVSFSDQAITHLAAVPLDAVGKQAAVDAIVALRTRNNTNLYEGWLEGAEQVALHMADHPELRHRLLLLTDGWANRGIMDPRVLAEVASGLRVRGISTSTVGIGADYSSEQIEGIAEHGGGMLHHAQNPSEIVEVVLAELRDMRATCIENLEVSVDLGDGPSTGSSGDGGVAIEVVALASQPQTTGACAIVGDLAYGATRRAVFRVLVPEGPTGQVLAFRITARWQVGGAEERRVLGVQAALSRANDEVVEAEPTDQARGMAAARLWQAEVVRRALSFNRDGQYQEFFQSLGEQLRYFRRFCARLSEGAELVAGLEHALDRVMQPMEERARKEILTAMYKAGRGVSDYRANAPLSWRDFLKE